LILPDFDAVVVLGKLTDRIWGPASTGGALELDPAPPDAHGVEWVAFDLLPDEEAPSPGKADEEARAAREPGMIRWLAP
jgi:hypothetical protein